MRHNRTLAQKYEIVSVTWRKIREWIRGGSVVMALVGHRRDRRDEDGVFGDWGSLAVDFGPEEDGVDAIAVLV